jgi:transposase
MSRVNIEIVKRSDTAKQFVVLPMRWIVVRTFAWLGRCRRLPRDWEFQSEERNKLLRMTKGGDESRKDISYSFLET